jgi:hypothetical protein
MSYNSLDWRCDCDQCAGRTSQYSDSLEDWKAASLMEVRMNKQFCEHPDHADKGVLALHPDDEWGILDNDEYVRSKNVTLLTGGKALCADHTVALAVTTAIALTNIEAGNLAPDIGDDDIALAFDLL